MAEEALRPGQKVVLASGERVTVGAVDVPTPAGPIACWSYLTEGFGKHDQAEILFLLRRTPLDPEPSHWPLHAFVAIAEHARRGQIVRAGGHTGFATNDYLARRGWAGWMYLPSQRAAGVSPQTLHAVAITTDELAVVRAFGATRIAARFGRGASYWPCPPWSEPHASFAAPGEAEQSILASARLAGGLDITVTQAGERVRVQLPKLVAAILRDAALPDDAPVALAATVGDWADACMVWSPGQAAPAAIQAPGTSGQRLAAAFVLFVPQQEADSLQLVEDGIAARLTDATWAKLRTALTTAGPGSVLLGDVRLELEWV